MSGTKAPNTATSSRANKGLAATVGVGAAALLLSYVPMFEGMVLRGYKDPIGIVTACAGHTKTAVFGRAYSRDECLVILEHDLIDHAKPVLKCSPILKDKPYQLAAATSFAFNFGTNAYCTSSIARAFNAGDFVTACKRFNENALGQPQWVSVKDKYVRQADGTYRWTYKVLPGLVKRRGVERAMCEERI